MPSCGFGLSRLAPVCAVTQRVTVPHVSLALENHAHRLLSDARFRVRLRGPVARRVLADCRPGWSLRRRECPAAVRVSLRTARRLSHLRECSGAERTCAHGGDRRVAPFVLCDDRLCFSSPFSLEVSFVWRERSPLPRPFRFPRVRGVSTASPRDAEARPPASRAPAAARVPSAPLDSRTWESDRLRSPRPSSASSTGRPRPIAHKTRGREPGVGLLPRDRFSGVLRKAWKV